MFRLKKKRFLPLLHEEETLEADKDDDLEADQVAAQMEDQVEADQDQGIHDQEQAQEDHSKTKRAAVAVKKDDALLEEKTETSISAHLRKKPILSRQKKGDPHTRIPLLSYQLSGLEK